MGDGAVDANSRSAPFLSARDLLLRYREDYEIAYRDFVWPKLDRFNWALDYFDAIARNNAQPALWLLDEDGSELKLSFAALSQRSNQVANSLRARSLFSNVCWKRLCMLCKPHKMWSIEY